MSRIVGGMLFGVGILAAIVATWNVYFGEPSIGQFILGVIGLGVALFFAATLQENPVVQRVAMWIMLVVDCFMVGPLLIRIFLAQSITLWHIGTGLVGAVLLFVNWRALPR